MFLEAEATARQAQQTAQVLGTPSEIINAEWDVAEAAGATLAYELRQAGNWNRGLRFAIRHFHESLRAMLMELLGLDVLRQDIRELRTDADDLIEAVANLEAQRTEVAL